MASINNTQQSFTTSCCQGIAFTFAPAAVFGNISLYSSRDNSYSRIFSYALDSPPTSGPITVTPIITAVENSLSDHSVIATPSSITFLRTYSSSELTGNFYLSSDFDTAGVFLVSLKITGQDRSNFTSDTALVNILTNSQSLPAPMISSCIFDNSGGYFVVAFSTVTDEANIRFLSWKCSMLFDFHDADNTNCSWTSLSTVKGFFSVLTDISLHPGDTLSVRGGKLKAACRPKTECSLNAYLLAHPAVGSGRLLGSSISSSVIVQQPLVPLVPLIVLGMPSRIGSCNNLTVDLSSSTGNGARRWSSVNFTLLSSNGAAYGETVAIAAYMTNNYVYSSNTITVPRSLLNPTTYAITVTIKNFLGSSASKTSLLDVSGDPNLPTVTILGSYARTIKALNPLTVEGTATLSNCAKSYSLHYNYTVTDSLGVILPYRYTNIDPRKFYAPAYFFTAGQSYKITLSVVTSSTITLSRIASASSVTQVYIKHGIVVAAVRDGYSREASIDDEIVLDAAISTDEDSPSASNTLFYRWTCSIATPAFFGAPCNFASNTAIQSDRSSYTIPSHTMQAKTSYNFVVTVTSSDGRSASQTVFITALLSGAPVLTSSSSALKFNSDSQLVIPAAIYSNLSTLGAWSAYSYGYPVSLDAAYTPITRIFAAKEAVKTISYPLAVAANTFIGGRIYTFRLTATPTLYPNQLSFIEITMLVNSPPVGGYATVTPHVGFALETKFYMVTGGWIDDVSDCPLAYSFAYESAISDYIPALILTVASPLPYARSSLPPGLLGGELLHILLFTAHLSHHRLV